MPVSNGVEYITDETITYVMSADSSYEVSEILSITNQSLLIDFTFLAVSNNNFPKITFVFNYFDVYEANWTL